jgi:hypothetical protein
MLLRYGLRGVSCGLFTNLARLNLRATQRAKIEIGYVAHNLRVGIRWPPCALLLDQARCLRDIRIREPNADIARMAQLYQSALLRLRFVSTVKSVESLPSLP